MGRKEWANSVLCLIIFGVIAYGIHRVAGASDVVELFNPEVVASTSAVNLEKEVVLEKAEIEINGVTKEINAAFEITNDSREVIRDIVISCDYLDRNNELRGRGRWIIYDDVAPLHSDRFSLTQKRYISYLVDPRRISCRIIDLDYAGGSFENTGAVH